MIDGLELQYLTEMGELHAAYLKGEAVTSEMVRAIGRKFVVLIKARRETAEIFQALENGEDQ